MCTRADRQEGALAGVTTEGGLLLAGTSDHRPADRRPATTEGLRRKTVDVRLITGGGSQIMVGTVVAAVAVAVIRADTADSDSDSDLFVYKGIPLSRFLSRQRLCIGIVDIE